MAVPTSLALPRAHTRVRFFKSRATAYGDELCALAMPLLDVLEEVMSNRYVLFNTGNRLDSKFVLL